MDLAVEREGARWTRLRSLGSALRASASGWLERAGPLSWLFLVAWAVWRFEPFYAVGMASGDQAGFSLQGLGDFWHEVLGHARAQGRVYFLFTKIIDLWLAARPEAAWIHIFNIAVFALSPVCFACAVLRARADRLLYVWLFASLCWAGYDHMPPAAYPSVNHLPFLLWALAAYLVRRQQARDAAPGWSSLLGFAGLSFFALFQYEPVAAMSLCVLGALVLEDPRPQLRRQLGLALVAAALLYLGVYVGWRAVYPARYDGVQPGALSLWNVLRVAIAYSRGGLPFSEAYQEEVPLYFGDQHVGLAGLQYPHPSQSAFGADAFALLMTALALLALLRAHAGAARAPAARRAAPWLVAVLLLLGINGPLGLSAKYQLWVRDLDETYLTSQLALYPLVLLGTLLLGAAYRKVRARGVPLLFVALAGTVAALSLQVHAHNWKITSRQRANLARWQETAAFAAYAGHIEEAYVVAPDLYYTCFVGIPDWSRYWSDYVHRRYGARFTFLPSPPTGREKFALLRSHLSEDGRLRALSVQTATHVAIVARRANAPLALVSAHGTATPLDWSFAQELGRSGYSSLTLVEPPELLGTEPLEPVWVWPQHALQTGK